MNATDLHQDYQAALERRDATVAAYKRGEAPRDMARAADRRATRARLRYLEFLAFSVEE